MCALLHVCEISHQHSVAALTKSLLRFALTATDMFANPNRKPGDLGFDPLNLGSNPATRAKYVCLRVFSEEWLLLRCSLACIPCTQSTSVHGCWDSALLRVRKGNEHDKKCFQNDPTASTLHTRKCLAMLHCSLHQMTFGII